MQTTTEWVLKEEILHFTDSNQRSDGHEEMKKSFEKDRNIQPGGCAADELYSNGSARCGNGLD